jgi:hypothetical protein
VADTLEKRGVAAAQQGADTAHVGDETEFMDDGAGIDHQVPCCDETAHVALLIG